MAAATEPQQQPPSSAAEEALKRNTDCVYFLASPLTCKKGSGCEYRHSEYARVNPRDCYFWLNGNCLNPKCRFRHPPLDGLLESQAAVCAASSLTSSQAMPAPATSASQGPAKQAVPCIFFQKGLCLKGDRCAFSHGPDPTTDKLLQSTGANLGTETQPLKKALGVQKCSTQLKVPNSNFSKEIEASEVKSTSKADALPRDGVGIEQNLLPHKSMDGEIPKCAGMILPPAVEGSSSHSNCLHESQVADDPFFQNGKDGDDFLKDSSPGFDVLVDDKLRDSHYYRGDEGRNLKSLDEYDMCHSADYSSMGDIDRETCHDQRGYDSYGRMEGRYDLEQQHRASSERILMGPARLERKGLTGSPEHIDELDLRYHLSKQRRGNGLRSVVSYDVFLENNVEEQGLRGTSRRDSHHIHESSISSRLRGRIILSGRSADNGSELHGEMEVGGGRNLGRLTPGMSQISSQQGRFRDRIKVRVEEQYSEGRNFRGQMRGERVDGSSGFAGPKSLAELKVVKNVEGGEQQSLRKRKYLEDRQPSDANLSFKGPLSLGEILRRKRDAEAAASGGINASVSKVDVKNNEATKHRLIGSSNSTAVVDAPDVIFSALREESIHILEKDKEEFKSGTAAATGKAGESNKLDHIPSQLPNTSEPEIEDGMVVDQGVENNEYEGDDPRDDDYEYEQVDEGDYNIEEGVNVDVEEEYAEDEDDGDEDDFAKKIGVMFS